MLSSLKIKSFRIYWLGMLISLIGTWVQSLAQSWLVFELTKSAFLLGVVGFLGSIPIFFLSLFGGILADRLNKRNILICTQIAFMILAFLLAILTQLKLIRPAQIMLIAALNGVVMSFESPSRQAIVVEITGKKHLLNAIALNSVAFNLSRMLGPALCGVLVALIGLSGCFYLNAISFLAAIIALLFIRIDSLKNNTHNSAWKDLRDGLSLIKNNHLILALISMVAISSLFGVPYIVLMPIIAGDVLRVGVKGLGLLMSSIGLGALIGALTLARLGDFKHKGRFLLLSSIIFSVFLILFSLSKIFLFSLIALIFMGGSSVMAMALINTLLQTMVSDEFRGRMVSAFMFTFAGVLPFGNLLAGILSQAIGVSSTLIINGVICLVFFTAIGLFYPAVRNAQ